MPMSDAIFKSGMMWPIKITGNPVFMLHTCVDLIFLPSGRLTVSGFVANLLFSTSTPSITKMDIAPISATARFVAIVIALRYCGFGLPYKSFANAANDVSCDCSFWLLLVAKFDVTIVTLSSSVALISLLTSVGSGKQAETKFLHLFAVSAPHRQKYPRCCIGSFVLCIPLVHGAYPRLIHCCAFLHVNPT